MAIVAQLGDWALDEDEGSGRFYLLNTVTEQSIPAGGTSREAATAMLFRTDPETATLAGLYQRESRRQRHGEASFEAWTTRPPLAGLYDTETGERLPDSEVDALVDAATDELLGES